MKKIFLLIVFFMLVVGICACNFEGQITDGSEKQEQEDPTPVDPEDPEEIKYLTVTEAYNMAMAAGSEGTAEKQYVVGKVKNITNTNYGEMYITDGTTDLYVYGVYSADGSIRYIDMEDKPYSGDVVYLYGYLKTFNDKPELGASWLQKFDKNTEEIDLSEYTELSILEARNSEVGSKVIVEGVVAQITYASGMKPNGVYLVDETGSIYVYGLEIAGRVKIGEKAKLAGTKTLYILESEQNDAATYGYQGSIQLQDSLFISKSEGTFEFSKASIEESTVKKMLETPLSDNITTKIFKVTAIVREVPGSGFTNFYINDLDNKTGSYCYSLCNGNDFTYLREFDGKICDVYLSALNCKATKSGTVYRLIPIAVKEKTDFRMSDSEIAKFALEYYAAKQFLKEYNSDPELELLTSVSNEYIPFENVAISYESLNENLISFVQNDNLLVMHVADGNEVAQIKLTAIYNGAKEELLVDINVNTKAIPDTISIADAIGKTDGTEVLLRGIVMSGTVNQTGFYLNDGTGVIAVLTDAVTIKTLALGNEIIIKGTKTHITKNAETWIGECCINGATVEVNLLGNNPYDTSTFITDLSFAEILTIIPNVLDDLTTNVYVATCYLNKVESQYSTNFYLASTPSGKDIYLYAGSGSQYSIYDDFVGKEITVTFALVNWNSKSPYRACIISATDGETTILNNYNFR